MRAYIAGFILVAAASTAAQDPALTERNTTEQTAPATADVAKTKAPAGKLLVPAGTKVPMQLRNVISTKTARAGDAVYAQTTFPIIMDDRMLIPPGTYVQGRISSVKRAGRVKGRAEVLFHFTTLVFPSGYTVSLPGAVDRADSDKAKVSDAEGTIQHEGEKRKDAATVGTTAAQGTAIGAIATRGATGAGVGGAIGGATGLAIGLLSRGGDVILETGTSIEMVLQRDLLLDEKRVQ